MTNVMNNSPGPVAAGMFWHWLGFAIVFGLAVVAFLARYSQNVRRWGRRMVDRRWITTWLIPILAGIPSVLLAWSNLSNSVPATFFEWFKCLLATYPQFHQMLLAAPVFGLVAIAVITSLRERLQDRDNLSQKQASLLVTVLDRVVGRKERRFGEVAHRLRKNGSGSRKKVFDEITKPESQIEQLVTGVHYYFQAEVASPDKLKVVLVRMQNNAAVGFEYYVPENMKPRTKISDLTPEAAMNRAARENKIVVISDIEQEIQRSGSRKYAPGGAGSKNRGSLICFPVLHQHLSETPYVISVKCDMPGAFTLTDRARYEEVLQRFADRIAMEYSLLVIKEETPS